jgi:hypothetical protein
MPDTQTVIATGLFTLGGVVLGALLTPLTQLFLEWMRERRASHRARLLIGGELLHAQMTLRMASTGDHWLWLGDPNAHLPTSAWQENRSNLVGHIDEELFNELVREYALLEIDRERFLLVNRISKETPLPAEVSEGMKAHANKLGRLRRKLGGGGGWLDEIQDELKR